MTSRNSYLLQDYEVIQVIQEILQIHIYEFAPDFTYHIVTLRCDQTDVAVHYLGVSIPIRVS